MSKKIDARNLPCPKPVILTKNAIDAGETEGLTILVDNAPARENVKRFLKKQGFSDIQVTTQQDDFVISIGNLRSSASVPSIEKAQTVFLSSQFIGIGDDALGELLMRGFLYTLTELDRKPQKLILMNSAVFLAVEGSSSLEHLRSLESMGISIEVCGTCLDFYGKKDVLQVGIISNMYSITESLLGDDTVIKIS